MIRVFVIGMSDEKGGVEAYIQNLCGEMDCEKYEIIYQWPEMTIDGKTWICPRNRHNYVKYASFWRRFFRENHFDVLYLNTCDVVSIDCLRFAKAAGIPVRILHSHSSGNQQALQRKMSLFHRLSEKKSRKVLHRYATHLFACSKVAGDWMFDGRTYQIIQNGIRLSKYRFDENARLRLREAYGYGDELLIGIIGRISPQKNPNFSVQVLNEVFARESRARAVFIGDGECRKETEDAVKAYGLNDKIRFVGAVDNVHEWMSVIDCMLMPSLFEGLPFALVEAQAEGLRCVVSSAVSREANLTGLVEYVGLEEDLSIWAGKILDACKISRRPDTRQKLTEAGYSIENTAKVVREILENAVSVDGCTK